MLHGVNSDDGDMLALESESTDEDKRLLDCDNSNRLRARRSRCCSARFCLKRELAIFCFEGIIKIVR